VELGRRTNDALCYKKPRGKKSRYRYKGGEIVDNNGKYTISNDIEYWNEREFFDTREQAILFGMERAKEKEWFEFYVGKVENQEIRAKNLGENILEIIANNHYNEDGEFAEYYLENVENAHMEILDKRIEKIISEWANEFNYQPSYFLVRGTEEIDVIRKENEE
jgi:hypothetical protein